MNRKLKASLVPICVFTLSFGIGLGLQALAREKPEAQPTLNNTSNNTLTTPAVNAISLNHDIDPVEIEKLSLESVIKKIRAGDFQISIDNLRGDDGYIIPEEALFAVYLFSLNESELETARYPTRSYAFLRRVLTDWRQVEGGESFIENFRASSQFKTWESKLSHRTSPFRRRNGGYENYSLDAYYSIAENTGAKFGADAITRWAKIHLEDRTKFEMPPSFQKGNYTIDSWNFRPFLKGWSRENPDEAIAWLNNWEHSNIPINDNRLFRSTVPSIVNSLVSRLELGETIEWADRQSLRPDLEGELYFDLFTKLRTTDEPSSFEWLKDRIHEPYAQRVTTRLARIERDDRISYGNWLTDLPDSDARSKGLNEIAERWLENAPEELALWVIANDSASEWLEQSEDNRATRILEHLIDSNTLLAEKWIERFPSTVEE